MKPTNKYRVIQETPWTPLKDIISDEFYYRTGNVRVKCSQYPNIFAPLYEMADGTLVAEGDTVWRIMPDMNVKGVKLTMNHISGGFELFSSVEKAREQLSVMERQTAERYKDRDLYSAIENVVLFSKTLDYDNSSPAEMKRKISQIQQRAEDALNILKAKKHAADK